MTSGVSRGMTSQEGGMGIVVRAGGKITFVGSAFSAGAWFDRGCLSVNFVWPAVTKGRHDIIWKADMTSYHKPSDQSLIHRPIGFSIGQATEKWLVFLHCSFQPLSTPNKAQVTLFALLIDHFKQVGNRFMTYCFFLSPFLLFILKTCSCYCHRKQVEAFDGK